MSIDSSVLKNKRKGLPKLENNTTFSLFKQAENGSLRIKYNTTCDCCPVHCHHEHDNCLIRIRLSDCAYLISMALMSRKGQAELESQPWELNSWCLSHYTAQLEDCDTQNMSLVIYTTSKYPLILRETLNRKSPPPNEYYSVWLCEGQVADLACSEQFRQSHGKLWHPSGTKVPASWCRGIKLGIFVGHCSTMHQVNAVMIKETSPEQATGA